MDKVAAGQNFLQVVRFYLSVSFNCSSPYVGYISPGGGTISQLVAGGQRQSHFIDMNIYYTGLCTPFASKLHILYIHPSIHPMALQPKSGFGLLC
jgi:hypothetical protein